MTTLGIVGSGQLGRMLALAALPLGVHCRFLTVGDDAAIRPFGERVGAVGDDAAERVFAHGLDAITTEIENIDSAVLERVGQHAPVWPPVAALARKRDRRAERALLADLGLPQPGWAATGDPAQRDANAILAELAAAVERVGTPARVKAAIGGYDGRGQWRITKIDDVRTVDPAAAPFVVEREVPFEDEFSLIAVFPGEAAPPRFYTPSVNIHARGILARCEVAEGRVPEAFVARAETIVRTLGHAMRYRGVMGVELYRVGDDVLVNEFAPRVHNSGHWTQDAATASQFENHVRAVLGLPLAATALRAPCVSWNVIGRWPDRAALLAVPDLHVHDYGKGPRAGRKLGHVTLVGATPDDARARNVEAAVLAARELAP